MDNGFHIDIDDESVLTSIFKDKFSEEERSNPDFPQYLSKLCSYGIQQLNQEPQRLSDEKSNVLSQTLELAFHNYKTFIQTAECSRNIFQDFSIVEEKLQSVIEKIPGLSKHGKTFTKEASEISTIRHVNSLTLTRHTELLEILEIPQLMDTCVRNQYYEDALELLFFVKRLDKKQFISEIPVINGIIKDIQQSAQLMLDQLLGQLRSSIQLPVCLRVVGFLRRLECFTETELRLKFLEARNSWLDNILSNIPHGETETDCYDCITRTIEVCRIHLFDIVTQYRAIFSDESTVMFEGKNSLMEDMPSEASVFHCWLLYRINRFLSVLKRCLAIGVGNRLDSILGQCMYFGQSFSRVGADFRCLLIPIFEKHALDTCIKLIEQATQDFETDMLSFSLVATAISSSATLSTPAMSLSNSSIAATPQPPIGLLDFLPLAVYLNGILASLNYLRTCCALSMAVNLPPIISVSISRVTDIILNFHQAEEPAFSDAEKKTFVRFCFAFVDDTIPHINACLRTLLSHRLISDTYGSLATTIRNLKDYTGPIRLQEIHDKLSPFLTFKQVDSSDQKIQMEEESLNESSHTYRTDKEITEDPAQKEFNTPN